MSRPLDGVRIVEVAGYVFVPLAGSIMADLGADVIKVEPRTGDMLRATRTGSAQLGSDGPEPPGSLLAELANRGKRSIALDLSTARGRDVLDRLVAGADVFTTSYLERVRRSLRIEADDIRAVNAAIVYARGSGWGSSGPMRDTPAFDLTSAWASSGMAASLVDRSGEPPPMPVGVFDVQAANALAGAIGMALFKRARTGEGSVVDTSLLNVGMWAGQVDIAAAPHRLPVPKAQRTDPFNPLVNFYRTADGRWIYLSVMRADGRWQELCGLLGADALVADPRFATDEDRTLNRMACAAALSGVFAQMTFRHWCERLAGFSGPWGPMHEPAELHDHPAASANGFLTPHRTTTGFELSLVAPPMHFDGAPTISSGPAPEIGQHTELLLEELGFDWSEIERMRVEGCAGPA